MMSHASVDIRESNISTESEQQQHVTAPLSCTDCTRMDSPKAGFHVGRVVGICMTSAIVLVNIVMYTSIVLIPGLSSDIGYFYGVAPLFVASATLLVISLYRTYFTHPGRVPSNCSLENVRTSSARAKEVILRELAESRGVDPEALLATQRHETQSPLPWAECTKCRRFKLFDIHHCSNCGECILRMDHHCPWIGQCVGRDNHKYFTLFLFYTSFTALLIVASALGSPALDLDAVSSTNSSPNRTSDDGEGGGNISGGSIAFFICWIICAAFGVILIPFTIMTVQNASTGMTTLDRLNQKRRRLHAQRLAEQAEQNRQHSGIPPPPPPRAAAERTPLMTPTANGSDPSKPLQGTVGVSTIEAAEPSFSRSQHQAQSIIAAGEETMNELHAQRTSTVAINVHGSSNTTRQSLEVQAEKESPLQRTWKNLQGIMGDAEPQSSVLWWLVPTAPKFSQLDVYAECEQYWRDMLIG